MLLLLGNTSVIQNVFGVVSSKYEQEIKATCGRCVDLINLQT